MTRKLKTALVLITVFSSLASPLAAMPAQASSLQPSVDRGEGVVCSEPGPPYWQLDSGLGPGLANPFGLEPHSLSHSGPARLSQPTLPEPATQATNSTYALAWPTLSQPGSLNPSGLKHSSAPASDLPPGVPSDADFGQATYALPTTLPEAAEPQPDFFLSPPLKPLADSATGSLSIEVIAAYNFVVDSNVESPSTYAPSVATIGARFCNTSTVDTLTNVWGHIGNYIDGTNDTPGLYPTRDSSTFATDHPLYNTGIYSFDHIGGRAGLSDASRYVGDLAPGECKTQYWHITYPQCSNSEDPPCSGTPVWGDSVKPDDDLWLLYDVWATAAEGDMAEVTRKATMRNEISAMANKIEPQGGAWFNTQTDVVAPGDVITSNGVRYELGNINKGFDNDGDGDYDYNAWLQPIGDPSYDPSCFRLIRTTGVLTVSRSGGPDLIIPFTDQLYFTDLPSDNTGVEGNVHYTFMALDGPCNTSLTPYQEVASGADNEKFNADYGTGIPPIVSSEPKVEIDKTGNVTVTPGSTVEYAIPFENNGDADAGLPLVGMPLVISDTIPPSTTLVSANYNFTSGIGILYSIDHGATWTTTQPVPISQITNIQWWLADTLHPGESGVVTFSVAVDPSFPPPGSDPYVENCADARFDRGPSFDEACAITLVEGDNRIGDTVWRDDNGNGIQDAGETGIANVTVSLYYDKNGDGKLDSGDMLVVTATTSITGFYSFNNLPNGNFLVQVDSNDSDLPFGYGPTTQSLYPVTLNNNNYLDADFGFGPALRLDKKLISGDPAYEGELITYAISLVNTRPGNGTGQPSPCTYIFWAKGAGTGTGSNAWFNPTYAAGQTPSGAVAELNGAYATSQFDRGNQNQIYSTSYNGSIQAGTTTGVEALFYGYVSASVGSDSIDADLFHSSDGFGTSRGTRTFSAAEIATYIGKTNERAFVWDVSNLHVNGADPSNWTWSDFTGTDWQLRWWLRKSGGGSSTTFYLDSLGFRVTTDQTCGGSEDTIATLPMTDTYDATKLQFVSAVPPQNSLYTTASPYTTTGVISWTNLGPLYAGQTKVVTVTFRALEPPGNVTTTITNTAAVTNARFTNDKPVNPASDTVTGTLAPTGVIGDFVWRDLDGDGVQDGGAEVGIGGVVISLTANVTITISGVAYPPGSIVTTTTDANGQYLFEGLRYTGRYTVTVVTSTLPGVVGPITPTYELTNTLDSVLNNRTTFYLTPTLAAGGNQLGADFGYSLLSIVEGYIWNDWNRNSASTPDAGEEWLTGVVVTLTIGSNTYTTTTNSNGYYRFTGAFTGTYTVTVGTGSGDMSTGTWTQSFDTDGLATPNQSSGSVITGGAGRADFSYYETGLLSLGDTLYVDWDGDSTQGAGEEGIANITVSLYEDSNGDGIINPATDALIITTTTNASGIYTFTGLITGTYIVVVDENDPDFPFAPGGYQRTQDYDGTKDGQAAVNLTTSIDTVDFGYQPVGYGSIGDFVWRDLDQDTIQDGGIETGIANITVSLYEDSDSDGVISPTVDALVMTTTTDANGVYTFTNLAAGDYLVQVDTSDSDLPTDGYGNPYVLSTSNNPITVTLSAGQSYLDADFGFTAGGAIGDLVWRDDNQDGDPAGEPGIGGVVVELYDWTDVDGDGIYSSTVDTLGSLITDTTTNASGYYTFTGLVAGNYLVVVDTATTPATTFTYDLNGPYDGQASVILQPGQVFWGADFGLPNTNGSIGDRLWIDLNGNDTFEPWEPGLAGIVISLTNSVGTVITTTTDNDGYYIFPDLISGTYTVTVNAADIPSGLVQSFESDGSLNQQTTITLAQGENNFDVDFGYVPDLSVTKASSGGGVPLNAGDTITYTIVVSNPSPATVTGVTISDTTPANTNFVPGSIVITPSSAGSPGAPPIIVSPLTVTADSLVTITFQVTVTDPIPADVDTITNTVLLTSTMGVTDTDTVTDALAVSDLTITKSDNPDPVSAGQVLTYTLVFTNNGPAAAQNVTVTEQLPAGVTYGDDVSLPTGMNRVSTSPPTWVTPTLAAGQSGTIVFTVTVGSSVSGTITNTVSITTTTPDSNPNNNDDEEPTTVQQADLTITKSDNPDPVTAGQILTYTLSYTNNGLVAAQDVYITDTLPVSVTFGGVVSESPPLSGPTQTAQLLTWFTPTLAAGASGQIIFTVTVGSNVSGTITNSVTVTTTTPDSNPNNNDDNEPTDVQQAPATIGNYVWNDTNADGNQGAAESGLSGVTVTLYTSLGTFVAQTTTNASGYYTFTNVLSGTYYVVFTAPVGYVFSPQDAVVDTLDSDADASGQTANFSVSAGETNLTIDAGLYQPADVTIVKSDNPDPVTAGGVLTYTLVFSNNGPATAQPVTVTEQLPAGVTYGGDVSLPGGMNRVSTSPPTWVTPTLAAGQNGTIVFTVTVGSSMSGTITNTVTITTSTPDSNPNNNRDDEPTVVTTVQLATIGDYVWNDANANGIQDGGETGLSAVEVGLYTGSGTFVISTTTNASGLYSFTNVVPGTYYISFTAPAGYVFSPQNQGGDDTLDSDAEPTTHSTAITTLTAGENDTTWDAGLYRPAIIGDRVWDDVNGNGIQEVGEGNLSGITVTLRTSLGVFVAETTTDAGGIYTFTNVVSGSYYISFTAPAGYVFSPQDQGVDEARDSDAGASGQTVPFSVSAGDVNTTIDAGLYQPADVTIVKSDNPDPVTAGGVLTYTLVFSNNGPATAQPVTVTEQLPAGVTYGGDVSLPAGMNRVGTSPPTWVTPTLAAGQSGTIVFTVTVGSSMSGTITNTVTITTTTPDSNPNNNRDDEPTIVQGLATIGDYVWNDTNANGIQDAAESGLSGVTVTLYTSLGTFVAQTTTNASGYYTFTNVLSGTYYVVFTAPVGYIFSPQDAVVDTLDSDATPATGQTANFSVSAGETNLTIDAGLYQPADVTIVKSDNPDPVTAGGVLTYTLVFSNNGPATAQPVTVTEQLPAGVTYGGDVSLPAGMNRVSTSPPTWVTPTLAAGQSGTIVFTVTVGSSVSGTITNTVTITTSTPDSNPNNNRDDEPTVVTTVQLATIGDYVWNDVNANGIQDGGEAGLSGITVTLYTGGGSLVETTTTDASGYYTFTNVVSGTYYVEFTATAGYTFTVLNANGNLSDTVDSDANPTTGRTGNFSVNAGQTDRTIDAGLYGPPDIEIDKRVTPGEAAYRMPFTYTILITNTGQVTLNPVTLTDTLPADFYYVAGSGSPSNPDDIAEPLLVWFDLGLLDPGDSLTVTFVVTATPGITGTYINVATTTGTTPTGTVTDTDDTPVAITDPAVEVEKQVASVDMDDVAPNFVTFTIAITNVGPSIIDELPLLDLYDTTYLSFVNATPYPEEDADDGLLTWYDLTGPAPNGFNRNLPPGEAFLVTTVFSVVQDITTTINTAIVRDTIDIYTNPANDDQDDAVINNIPTAVTLLYFRVGDVTEQQVRLEWATAVEVDNFGFGLYRAPIADRSQASFVAFIPAQAHSGGATYDYVDTVPSDGVWWYWLADVDTMGKETFHGPTSARVGATDRSNKIYLPLIMRGE